MSENENNLVCPACKAKKFTLIDKVYLYFWGANCPNCSTAIQLKVSKYWYVAGLIASPLIFLWIVIPIIAYSPVNFLIRLGVGYELSVLLSLGSLIFLYSFVAIVTGCITVKQT